MIYADVFKDKYKILEELVIQSGTALKTLVSSEKKSFQEKWAKKKQTKGSGWQMKLSN